MTIDSGVINVLLWTLVIAVIGYCAFWAIDRVGIPAPFVWIVRLVVLLILLIAWLRLIGAFSAIRVADQSEPLTHFFASALFFAKESAISALT